MQLTWTRLKNFLLLGLTCAVFLALLGAPRLYGTPTSIQGSGCDHVVPPAEQAQSFAQLQSIIDQSLSDTDGDGEIRVCLPPSFYVQRASADDLPSVSLSIANQHIFGDPVSPAIIKDLAGSNRKPIFRVLSDNVQISNINFTVRGVNFTSAISLECFSSPCGSLSGVHRSTFELQGQNAMGIFVLGAGNIGVVDESIFYASAAETVGISSYGPIHAIRSSRFYSVGGRALRMYGGCSLQALENTYVQGPNWRFEGIWLSGGVTGATIKSITNLRMRSSGLWVDMKSTIGSIDGLELREGNVNVQSAGSRINAITNFSIDAPEGTTPIAGPWGILVGAGASIGSLQDGFIAAIGSSHINGASNITSISNVRKITK